MENSCAPGTLSTPTTSADVTIVLETFNVSATIEDIKGEGTFFAYKNGDTRDVLDIEEECANRFFDANETTQRLAAMKDYVQHLVKDYTSIDIQCVKLWDSGDWAYEDRKLNEARVLHMKVRDLREKINAATEAYAVKYTKANQQFLYYKLNSPGLPTYMKTILLIPVRTDVRAAHAEQLKIFRSYQEMESKVNELREAVIKMEGEIVPGASSSVLRRREVQVGNAKGTTAALPKININTALDMFSGFNLVLPR